MSGRILTTLVGSYPIPDWLAALPSEQALIDATRVVFKIQEQAGIDTLTDGELYRFDVNHPDTNGMIEYFVSPLDGVRTKLGRADIARFHQNPAMSFRSRPAGVVEAAISEGALDLVSDFRRAAGLTAQPIRFTVTGPHMLSKTLLDHHYGSPQELAFALARVLAAQVADIDAAVIQLDEANLPGHPEDWEWAARADNIVLDAIRGRRAVHLCFGNYGGQTIQAGDWGRLTGYLSLLHADHVLLELTRRDPAELTALREVEAHVRFGVGVVDIKSNLVETADDIARRIERAAGVIGAERIAYVNPDCGFWMLKRSVVDRKIAALVEGRNAFEGRE
jgi:5-methyltetrahydropteroyltriglutamate--homocysteine methyltransferase